MVIGIPQTNWATELTNPDLLVDMAWNKIITMLFSITTETRIPTQK